MNEAIFTQFAALLAAALLIPSFIFLAYGVNHRNMPFWWTAAIAYFLIFFGSALAALRGFLPDLAVSFVANALVCLGYFMSLRAVRMAKGCWRLRYADLVVTGINFVGLVLVVSLINTYPARVALISTFIAMISIAAFLVTFRNGARVSPLGDAAIVVFGIGNATFASLRGISALLGRDEPLLSFAFWDQTFFIWSIAAVFCFAIGLFQNGTALISEETRQALKTERVLTEALTEALEGQRNLRKLVLHELKRPLNAIATSVDLSRKGTMRMSPDEVERIHQQIRVATDYLRRMGEYEDIDALFDTPTLTGMPIANLIEDIRNKWRIPVTASLDVETAVVDVDLLLFDIAVGNLIENAQKFGTDEVAVHVEIFPSEGTVAFDVIDDGSGIPPHEAERVFRQFYKIEEDRISTIGGCGLGLYVVQRMAQAHGGRCRVLSQTPSTLRLSLSLAALSRGPNA
jgi:signal transduction histidine kinase